MATPEQQRQAQTTVYLRPGPRGRTPVYATAGSAGCDLYASAPITLLPGETRLLSLDLVMALEPGVEAQVRPRSGCLLIPHSEFPMHRARSTAIIDPRWV